MGIAASAVLVELNVSSWGASKLDRDATDTTNHNNNATADAAKVYKNLAAGTSLVGDIAKYAARIRLYHNEMTLPWSNKGARILPTKLVFEYKAQMHQYKIGFENLCNKLFAEYYNIISNASQNLGSLYKASDYPDLDDVKAKYGMRLVFSPLPEAGDFRLDTANEDLRELREELESSYKNDFDDRVGKAVRGAWDRLHDELVSLSNKLKDEEGTKKRYYDSLLENPQRLCELLTKLNITNDPKLEEARRDLERALMGVDMQDIKEHEGVRSDVKAKVDDILKRFDW